jgi:two-component system response regulator DevR
MSIIRVMLVEDDPFWQENLSTDLNQEEDIQVIHIASTKEDAIEAYKSNKVDVILMDINLTENHLDGLEATQEIFSSNRGHVKIIMITSLAEKEIIMKSFQSGAVNYITKSSFKDIVCAVRDAYNEQSSIHSDVASIMRQEIQLMSLSPMEREVFDLRQAGLSKSQIAERLHKSANTIKTQMKSIRDKLNFFKD